MFLTSVTDAMGNVTTLHYDSLFRITSITDAMGRNTVFNYDLPGILPQMLITRITDPFGRTAQMTYDPTSYQLVSITDPIGITSSFTYSPTDTTFINTLTTPYGTSSFNETINPNDPVSGSITRSLTLTDPLGYTDMVYFYPNGMYPPASDPVPPPMGGTDNGTLQFRNTFTWNKHQAALGVTLSGGVPQSEDFTKSMTYHWLHVRVSGYLSETLGSIRPPLESRIWYEYRNQAGATYNQGDLDRPIATGRVLDTGYQVTTNSYVPSLNALGLPTEATDALGRDETYTYDTSPSNNVDLLTVKHLTAPSTYTTIATLGNYMLHEPQTYTGADGQTWNMAYNGSTGQLLTLTAPDTTVTTYNYDTSGRLSNIVNANSLTQVSYTYDGYDRVATRTDSEGYMLAYGYDALDRVTSITYPDGTTDLYDYTFQSGPLMGTPSLELRKHTDRLARVTTYAYDADRRLTSVTEPTTGTATRTTNYDYYEDGTLKDIIDADGNDTHWDIDIESRPIDKIYAYGTASAQTETYAYENSTSRLHSVTDALGQAKTYSYNADDSLAGITYTGSVNPTANVTYAYDPYFLRRTAMTDGLGTTNYSYTPIGTNGALKLSQIAGPFTTVPANDMLGFTYDTLGRLSGRTMAGGNETFGYDPISRLNAHATPLGSFTYGYLGQTDQVTSRSVTTGPTTVSTSWGYDTNVNDRRLISILNSGVSRSYALSYLIAGTTQNPYDVKSITDTPAAGHPWTSQAHSFTYDKVDRLLTANQTTPGNYAYGYDKTDNATTVTAPAGTVNPTYNPLNQIATWGAHAYAYDTTGNLLSGDGSRTYKWDAENRLIEIDYPGSTAKSQFAYDGDGHRLLNTETAAGGGVTTTRFMWCGGRICQSRDGSDNVLKRTTDEGEYILSTGQKLVYQTDQLGSVRDVINATSGNRTASYDYLPYGAITRSSVTTGTDYQYAGLLRHAVSMLNLSATRAQDGGTGRWITRDPIREAGGINLYGYVGAGPVNLIDPSGLCATDPDLCEKLADKIQRVTSELENRANELRYDPLGLPPTGPMSVGGHQQQFTNKQTQLRNLLNDYNSSGCGDGFPIPGNAWKYATMPPPVKLTNPIDQTPSTPMTPASSPWWIILFIPLPGNPLYAGF